MIYKKLHKILNTEQHEPQLKPGGNSGGPAELAAPLVTPVVLLLHDTNTVYFGCGHIFVFVTLIKQSMLTFGVNIKLYGMPCTSHMDLKF